MNELLQPLSTHAGTLIAFLLLAVTTLAGVAFWQAAQARKTRKLWQELCDGVQGANLERLLYDHLRGKLEIEQSMVDLRKRLDILDSKMETSKRYFGLIRFDAFEDVGGQQSFALAVYDEKGDGFVISSLIGRNMCRVFAKSITRGKSDRELTKEEQRAVEEAGYRRAQSVVSTP